MSDIKKNLCYMDRSPTSNEVSKMSENLNAKTCSVGIVRVWHLYISLQKHLLRCTTSVRKYAFRSIGGLTATQKDLAIVYAGDTPCTNMCKEMFFARLYNAPSVHCPHSLKPADG